MTLILETELAGAPLDDAIGVECKVAIWLAVLFRGAPDDVIGEVETRLAMRCGISSSAALSVSEAAWSAAIISSPSLSPRPDLSGL